MTEKHAVVVGASGGIGQAVVSELAARGWRVTGLSRSANRLDVTDEASVIRAMSRVDAPVHLLFIATGALTSADQDPEKAVKEVTPEAMAGQFAVNAMGPMLVLKHALPLLPKDQPATIAALSARVGSIGDNGIGGWHSYRTSKAALNQLFHGAAIELRRTHKRATVLTLHPGTVETPFTARYAGRTGADRGCEGVLIETCSTDSGATQKYVRLLTSSEI